MDQIALRIRLNRLIRFYMLFIVLLQESDLLKAAGRRHRLLLRFSRWAAPEYLILDYDNRSVHVARA